MDEKQIVKNIRKIRSSRKISLGRLAKLTGLTKGYVSKIENSDKAPPFSTLIKIANALNADIQSFIADDSEVPENTNLSIVRKGESKKASRGTLYEYFHKALAHNKIGKNMEPLIVEPPLEETATFSHEGEEFVYVLDGSHEFHYDGKKYILNEGDSVYFDSILSHGGRSIGNKRAKLLVVIYSYKRMKF